MAMVLAMFAELRVGMIDTDLDQAGVTHLLKLHHLTQLEINLLLRELSPDRRKFFDEVEALDDRIQNFRRLKDLKLRGDELWIVGALLDAAEDLNRTGVVQFHLHLHLREVFLGQEVSRDPGGHHYEKEGQHDEAGADLDDAPIV